jgi:hypothetical protein
MKETMRLGDEDQDWNFEALMNTEEKGFQKGKEHEEEYFFPLHPFESSFLHCSLMLQSFNLDLYHLTS